MTRPHFSRHTVTDAVNEGLLVERPEWHAQAACRGKGTKLFFPDDSAAARKARRAAEAYCARCPVAGPCAVAGASEWTGVWGGELRQRPYRTAQAERQRRYKERRKAS